MDTSTFHVEQPLVPRSASIFEELLRGESLELFGLEGHLKLSYMDTYWDTAGGDLHAAALLLRTRSRRGHTDFLDFKGPPRYLMGTLFARPFWSEKVLDKTDAESAIQLRRPSTTMQALYTQRPDLIGRRLFSVADAEVSRVNVNVVDGGEPVCVVSLHTYQFQIEASDQPPHQLIEVQPYSYVNATPDTLIKAMSSVLPLLEKKGFQRSPTSKYHRIPRATLETALAALRQD